MKKTRNQKHLSDVLSSNWQGVNYQSRINDENVNKKYFDWMSNWTSCPSGVLNEYFLFFYQLLPTRTYMKSRSKDVIDDVSCRLCKDPLESAKHIISNCRSLAPSLYKTRHDNALKCFIWPILHKFGFINDTPRWYSDMEIKPSYQKEGIQIFWDLPEYSGRDDENEQPLRPDAKLIIDNNEQSNIYLIEITIPWTENRKEKFDYKCEKYKDIQSSLKLNNPRFTVDQITLVMDVFGGYDDELIKNIGKIRDKESVKLIVRNMQKSVIASIANISRTFKIRCK